MTAGKSHVRVRALSILGPLALAAGVVAILAPAAVGGPAPCLTKNVRTGIEYKGATPLATAISQALAGDTINVYGTCVGNFTLSQNITLNGQGKNATLDGNHQGRVLTITGGTATIQGLTITNGQTTAASDLGGGIYVGTAAVLVNVTVSGNAVGTHSFGGGIEADFHSSLTLINSTVSGNTAGSSGGIDMFIAKASLTNSSVTGNHATGDDGCAFNNATHSCAGGIWNYHGTLALTDSTVSSNTAAYRGGGMRNDSSATDGTTILSGKTRITSNTAGDQGGGIWANAIGGVIAADGTATYKDPITAATLPPWTGSVSGNTPDQCSPALTIGTTTCGA